MKKNEINIYRVEVINLTLCESYVYMNIQASTDTEAANKAMRSCRKFDYIQPSDRIKIKTTIKK